MHGVDVALIESLKGAVGAAARIKQENHARLAATPTDITFVGWLYGEKKVRDQKLRSSMLIIEFDNERAANVAIHLGLTLRQTLHRYDRYDREQKVVQCFRCQAYGHIAAHCNRRLACAYCANEHDSHRCQYQHDQDHAKCAVCKRGHFAFDRKCPKREKQMEKASDMRATSPRY